MRQRGSCWRRWPVGGLWLGLLAVAPLAGQEIGAPRLDPELPLCLQLPTLDPQVVEVLWGVNTVALASDRPGPVTVRLPLPGAPGAVRLPSAGGTAQPGAVAGPVRPPGGPAGVAVGPLPASGPGGVTVGPLAAAGGPAGVATARPGEAGLSWPVPAATQLLVLRLLAGDREPALLARLPAVPTADLLALLPGLARWRREDREAADLLALELLRRPTTPQDSPGGLPSAVALAIADALARQGEERCVGWYRQLAQPSGAAAQRQAALVGWAGYLSAKGALAAAIEVWRQVEREPGTFPTESGNATVTIARLQRQQGDPAAAEATWRQAMQSGYGWAAGLARADLAGLLLTQGRAADGLAVLATPFSGQYAEQLGCLIAYQRGACLLALGRLAAAQASFEAALAADRAVSQRLSGEGLETVVRTAELALTQVAGFRRDGVAWTEPGRGLEPQPGGYAATVRCTVPRGWQPTVASTPGRAWLRERTRTWGASDEWEVQLNTPAAPARLVVEASAGDGRVSGSLDLSARPGRPALEVQPARLVLPPVEAGATTAVTLQVRRRSGSAGAPVATSEVPWVRVEVVEVDGASARLQLRLTLPADAPAVLQGAVTVRWGDAETRVLVLVPRR